MADETDLVEPQAVRKIDSAVVCKKVNFLVRIPGEIEDYQGVSAFLATAPSVKIAPPLLDRLSLVLQNLTPEDVRTGPILPRNDPCLTLLGKKLGVLAVEIRPDHETLVFHRVFTIAIDQTVGLYQYSLDLNVRNVQAKDKAVWLALMKLVSDGAKKEGATVIPGQRATTN